MPGPTPLPHHWKSITKPEQADFERALERGETLAKSMGTDPKMLSAIEKLVSMEIFSGFEKSHLSRLIETRKIRILDMEPEQRFIRDGEEDAETFFVIIHGKAEVTKSGHTLAELGAGDPVGHYGYLWEMPRTADVTTKSRCLLFEFSRKLIETDVETKYVLLSNIWKMLARYVKMTNAQIIKLEDKLQEYETGNAKDSNEDPSKECRVLVRTILDAAHRMSVSETI